MKKLSFKLHRPTSELRPWTSKLHRPTSELRTWTSKLNRRTSEIRARTSQTQPSNFGTRPLNFQTPQCDLRTQRSDSPNSTVRLRNSVLGLPKLRRPTSKLRPWTCPTPPSDFETPPLDLPDSTIRLRKFALGLARLRRPTSKLRPWTSKLHRPTSKLHQRNKHLKFHYLTNALGIKTIEATGLLLQIDFNLLNSILWRRDSSSRKLFVIVIVRPTAPSSTLATWSKLMAWVLFAGKNRSGSRR